MDLFEQHRQHLIATEAPLAARLRPRTLDDFIGQTNIVGPGRLLRRAIQADQLSSLIFYGPPGTGKTTLARIIANTTAAHFIAINAVLAGVKDVRAAVYTAQDRRGQYGQRTILFVDEVHRFNKAQQDALLPWVENGTLVLIGATTENPYFEVNKALVSRSRIFQLQPLTATDLQQVAHRALTDSQHGYGQTALQMEPDALDHLINIANGDARALLNALELAVETTQPDTDGTVRIDLAIAEASIQRRAVLYDKEGDAHFDTISAFIKSLRGSDPDAALYWLARMVYAGEDPRFIFRRMLILASEDVGLADPQAVGVVNACAQAFDRVGLPEGQYPLAQAALYLAAAPKSNSVLGYFDALATVEKERESAVPNPLKDGNRDKQEFGHGAGYKYPHAYREHWVAQQYLPDGLQGQVFYQPSDQGWEGQVAAQVARQREAQLAASETIHSPDVVSYSPPDQQQEQWLQRALSQTGAHAAGIRDRIFATLNLQRHHVVLDLHSRTGLLTWEALRQVPEGAVYTVMPDPQAAEQVRSQLTQLPQLQQPILLVAPLLQLGPTLHDHDPDLQFDAIVGRNAFLGVTDRAALIHQLKPLLAPQGHMLFAETVPSQSQRLSALVDGQGLTQEICDRWRTTEAAIYGPHGDPLLNWDTQSLTAAFEAIGLATTATVAASTFQVYVTDALLERWWTHAIGQQSYCDRLLAHLPQADVNTLRTSFGRALRHQTITWQTTIAWLHIHH